MRSEMSRRRQTHRTLLWTALIAALAVSPLRPALAFGEETLSSEERAQLLDLVDASRAQYLGLLARTSDAQWAWKPAENRWSVGECAEHILLSNEALFGTARRALAGDANPQWQEQTKGKTKFLLQVMPNRGPQGRGGAPAPQEIRPTGRMTRGEIVERFLALYEEMEELVKDASLPLRSHTEEHPFPVFGTLNAHQWLIYVPLHTQRHSKQMIEVMETEGFPAS